jgi:acetylornithine deacetylase/succinyl-diaminopimelate desuccinylase-like protein
MKAMAARRHLERLAAVPRPAGSPAEAIARRYCTDVLEEHGFAVNEEPFDYSSWPGRWATPLAGLASIVILGIAGHVGYRGEGDSALLAIVLGALIGGPLAWWVARRGVLDLPFGRARGINLRATRGSASPVVWLVAHLDSKSQPIPTTVRIAGIVACAVVWVIAAGVAAAQAMGANVGTWWTWIVPAGVVAAMPVAASVVGTRSPGALDNASGVATVLEALGHLERDVEIGVLITSGEELGLAGARAYARRHPAAVALNCDGVDDRGSLVCMRAGRGPSRSSTAIEDAAKRAGFTLTVRGIVPGLLVDAVALHDAGWDCATLSRGSWSTFARIHRPHDDLQHLSGTGVAEAALVLAVAVQQLRSDSDL